MLEDIAVAGVTWGEILIVLGWTIGLILAGKMGQISLTVFGKSKRFSQNLFIQSAFKSFGRPIPFLMGVMGLRIGLATLLLDTSTGLIADCFNVLFTISITFFIYSLVDVIDCAVKSFTAKTETTMDDMLAPMIRKSLRITIVIIALVQIAQILSNKPITTVLTGLGVGGLALALAAQETIKNFFGSMVICADKPFELGSRVKIGGHDGNIEEVGFRSTRLRTLDGHLITIPNGELANLMIQNIGKRPYIRRLMNVTITYDTQPDKVQEALVILRDILDQHEGMDEKFPPRVFFNEFNDYSLNLLAIYWYHPPEFWKYLAHAEQVNMELLKRYNAAGIEFAFPTQTVYVNGLGEQ